MGIAGRKERLYAQGLQTNKQKNAYERLNQRDGVGRENRTQNDYFLDEKKDALGQSRVRPEFPSRSSERVSSLSRLRSQQRRQRSIERRTRELILENEIRMSKLLGTESKYAKSLLTREPILTSQKLYSPNSLESRSYVRRNITEEKRERFELPHEFSRSPYGSSGSPYRSRLSPSTGMRTKLNSTENRPGLKYDPSRRRRNGDPKKEETKEAENQKNILVSEQKNKEDAQKEKTPRKVPDNNEDEKARMSEWPLAGQTDESRALSEAVSEVRINVEPLKEEPENSQAENDPELQTKKPEELENDEENQPEENSEVDGEQIENNNEELQEEPEIHEEEDLNQGESEGIDPEESEPMQEREDENPTEEEPEIEDD